MSDWPGSDPEQGLLPSTALGAAQSPAGSLERCCGSEQLLSAAWITHTALHMEVVQAVLSSLKRGSDGIASKALIKHPLTT